MYISCLFPLLLLTLMFKCMSFVCREALCALIEVIPYIAHNSLTVFTNVINNKNKWQSNDAFCKRLKTGYFQVHLSRFLLLFLPFTQALIILVIIQIHVCETCQRNLRMFNLKIAFKIIIDYITYKTYMWVFVVVWQTLFMEYCKNVKLLTCTYVKPNDDETCTSFVSMLRLYFLVLKQNERKKMKIAWFIESR